MRTFNRRTTLDWHGDVLHGSGSVAAGSEAFTISATFPRLGGEPLGTTTPEELLAASHAVCFGIGLRSLIARRGGAAERVRVTATLTVEKGTREICITGSHLEGRVEGLTGIEANTLSEIGRIAEEGCTISIAIRQSVAITVDVRAA